MQPTRQLQQPSPHRANSHHNHSARTDNRSAHTSLRDRCRDRSGCIICRRLTQINLAGLFISEINNVFRVIALLASRRYLYSIAEGGLS